MVEGGTTTVIGIARRPAPTASDHRYVVTPRFPADVRVSRGAAAAGTGGTSAIGAPSSDGSRGASSHTAPAPASATVEADLDDLAPFVGALVRVGGLVVELRSDGFTLDDGTATGRIVLRGEALGLLPLIEPDDALNAIGRVEAADGRFVVVVQDPGAIVLAGDPVAAAAPDASDPPVSLRAVPGGEPDTGGSSRLAGFGGGPWPVDPGAAGVGTLLAISAVSVAVTVLRRSRSRRRLARRIAGRLATLGAPADGLGQPNVAERGPSTNHAA
jgi:hypothetical protein